MNKKQIVKEANEKECLEFCLGVSNDPEFKRKIALETHAGRVKFLLDNGFTYEKETVK